MKIIIPMSGEGARFKRAGYTDPKPLIKVHGKPIIEYVVSLFPGENDFIFVCRDEHLATTDMRETLLRLKPSARIVSIPAHKFGPVYAVLQAAEFIRDDEPVVVNYCDFFMRWDWADFKRTALESGAHGCVPAYLGFHPHLLHEKNFYASMRLEADGKMAEIREKHSFTPDKTQSPQSPGTYYFATGAILKKYFRQMLDEDVNLNGEYYASLVYNLLKRDGLEVGVYDRIPHFCQWGTPEDLREYEFWIELIENTPPEEWSAKAAARFPAYGPETVDKIINYWRGYLGLPRKS